MPSAWIQTTLPDCTDGTGAVQPALSAFLVSAAGTHTLIYITISYPAVEEAKLAWNRNLTFLLLVDTK